MFEKPDLMLVAVTSWLAIGSLGCGADTTPSDASTDGDALATRDALNAGRRPH